MEKGGGEETRRRGDIMGQGQEPRGGEEEGQQRNAREGKAKPIARGGELYGLMTAHEGGDNPAAVSAPECNAPRGALPLFSPQ